MDGCSLKLAPFNVTKTYFMIADRNEDADLVFTPGRHIIYASEFGNFASHKMS